MVGCVRRAVRVINQRLPTVNHDLPLTVYHLLRLCRLDGRCGALVQTVRAVGVDAEAAAGALRVGAAFEAPLDALLAPHLLLLAARLKAQAPEGLQLLGREHA